MFHLAALFVIACRQKDRQETDRPTARQADGGRAKFPGPANEISCKTNSALNLIFTLLIRRVIQFRVFVQRNDSDGNGSASAAS